MRTATISAISRKSSFRKDWKRYKLVYLMLLPVLIYYVVFHYLPMLGTVIAFQNFKPAKGILGSSFVGI